MLHDVYLSVGIRLVAFDPYFIALDKIPKFEALAEVARVAPQLRAFGHELDRLSVIRYGHVSKYCRILSPHSESRRRSFHEVDYLFDLAETYRHDRLCHTPGGRCSQYIGCRRHDLGLRRA